MPLSVTLALFTLSMPALLPRRLNAVTGDFEDLLDLATLFVPLARIPKALSLLGKGRVIGKVATKTSKAPRAGKELSKAVALSRHAKARLAVEKASKRLQDNGFKVLAREVDFKAKQFDFRTRCDLVAAHKTTKAIFCIEVKYSKDGHFSPTPNQRRYHKQDSLYGSFEGPNAKGHREFKPQERVSVGMHQMCYRGENLAPAACRFPKD